MQGRTNTLIYFKAGLMSGVVLLLFSLLIGVFSVLFLESPVDVLINPAHWIVTLGTGTFLGLLFSFLLASFEKIPLGLRVGMFYTSFFYLTSFSGNNHFEFEWFLALFGVGLSAGTFYLLIKKPELSTLGYWREKRKQKSEPN